jgi:hypothetical protein
MCIAKCDVCGFCCAVDAELDPVGISQEHAASRPLHTQLESGHAARDSSRSPGSDQLCVHDTAYEL